VCAFRPARLRVAALGLRRVASGVLDVQSGRHDAPVRRQTLRAQSYHVHAWIVADWYDLYLRSVRQEIDRIHVSGLLIPRANGRATW